MYTQVKVLFASFVLFVFTSAAWGNSYADAINVFKNAGQSGEYFKTAYGFAIYPTVGKAGFVVGVPTARARCLSRTNMLETPR